MTSAYSNSSRALAFLSETSEDAIAALKGLVGGVGSAKYLDTSENTLATISVQIDSSRDEDRIVALTRIVAMISKGRDASQFLPAVLKLTSCSNLDVRKLVYIVLLRYANTNPDLTLLSINSFQRDLSDPSPLLRAMALRVLSSIKVRMVAPIVIMAVSKSSRDPNPYVRKIAALAIPKCFQIDSSQLPTLLENLSTLLADKSPFVLGAALSAFQQVCPESWHLLHPDYRKICHALADMDEWSQVTSLQVLLRYARANFAQPVHASAAKAAVSGKESAKQFVSENSEKQVEPSSKKSKNSEGLEDFLSSDSAVIPAAVKASKVPVEPTERTAHFPVSASTLNDDLQLLLSKSRALLHSRNAAVVMGAVRVVYYLSPPSDHVVLARPLLRILRSSSDITYVVLLNILTMVQRKSDIFALHATSFLVGASHEESIHVSRLKLDILVAISTNDNVSVTLNELTIHIRSPEEAIATHAITCLGKLASRRKLKASSKCLAALLSLLKKRKTGTVVKDSVIAQAVSVVSNLIQSGDAIDAENSDKAAAIIYRLAALLFGAVPKTNAADTMTDEGGKKKKFPSQKVLGKGAILHPVARASILWLLGQHARQSMTVTMSGTSTKEQRTLAEIILPDVLRRCAINFNNEAAAVKLQILTLSSKLFAFLPTVLTRTPGLSSGQQGRAESLVSTVTKLHFYLLKVARYDADFDVRDRARFCKGLTSPLADLEIKATDDDAPSTQPTDPLLGGDANFQQIINEAARSVGETGSDPDTDMKGVRLRREQVIHVLFEGKSVATSDQKSTAAEMSEGTSDLGQTPEIGTLSMVFGGKLIKGWLSTQLPPWTTTPSSSDLREPPEATTSYPANTSTLSNTAISHLKSFSSADFVSPINPPVVLVPTRSNKSTGHIGPTSGSNTPVDLDAAPTAAKAQQEKYKDLDSFLDESEDEDDDDEVLDGSAPEDDDYAAQEEWEVDNDATDSDDDDEEDEDEDDSEAD